MTQQGMTHQISLILESSKLHRYSAKYYNGVTSTPFEVEVELHRDCIRIYYQSAEESNEIEWPIEKIKEGSFLSKEELTLKFGDFPHQTLEVKDSNLIEELHKYPIFSASKKKYGLFYKGGTKTIVIASSLILGTILLLYLVVVPFLGEKASYLVPQSTEISMGEEMYSSIISAYKVDEKKTEQINAFAKEINFNTDYPIQITVVESKEQNAFAMPGGHIIVYSEILKNMHSPEQLVALLSHETSHITLRHTTKSLCKSIATAMVLSILISDVNGIAGALIQNADNLKSLSYSRSLEEEADKVGLDIMIANKINPKGMIQLFEQLKSAHDIDIPEFISTHPVSDTRISYIKEKIKSGSFNYTCPKNLQEKWFELKK
jgi:Zn-dependent protease with chaperone function